MPDTTWLQPLMPAPQANGQLIAWMTPWWKRLSSLLLSRCGNKQVPGKPVSRSRMELVFLPCAVVRISGCQESNKPVWPALLVNGYARKTSALNLDALGETAQNPSALLFPYPLSMGQTLESARQYLLNLQLRRVLRLSEQETKNLRWERVVQYPYWVRYAEHRSGKVRFEMLDGIVQQRGGTLVRQGFLHALNLLAREQDTAPQECCR